MELISTTLPDSLVKAYDAFLAANKQPIFVFQKLGTNQMLMPVQQPDNTVVPTPQNSTRVVPGTSEIRTPEGDMVTLLYSTRRTREMVGGVPMNVPVPEPIVFEAAQNCVVRVPRTERELLRRLLFSNECRNGINPAKQEPASGYVYELVQPEKSAADLAALKRAVGTATGALSQATDSEMAKACERLELPVSGDANQNYSLLFDLATTEPARVVAALGDEWSKHEALVTDLLNSGVIEFDQNARQFIILPGRTQLLLVPQGAHETALVKYLIETPEGRKIKGSLKQALDAKAKKK